jgi:hypothetical protein
MLESIKYIKCINYLISKKTHTIYNNETTIFQSLLNVYNILRKWECSEDVCYAGLFHLIFKIETEKNRHIIKELIGEKSEKIVFDFNKNISSSLETNLIHFANKLNHTFIVVHDDLYDKKNTEDFYLYFRDMVNWSFTGSGNGINFDLWRKYIYKLNFKNKIEKKLNKLSLSILKKHNLNCFLKLQRAYASINTYGTVHESHKDSEKKGTITVMYYLNNHWSLDHGGETVFYGDIDIIKSIIPKPSRAVIFDGTIPHCAREVRRDVNDIRIVLTFKYKFFLKNKEIIKSW